MNRDEFERKSFGIFKKSIDQYPQNYPRQNGAYSLFNREAYKSLLNDCLKIDNGTYELITEQDRTSYFFLALQEGKIESKLYSVFNTLILPEHIKEIIYKLLILFMDFQNIHPSSRKNFLKNL
ncbi:hypothetical protein [Leptospira weilii]|uniref:hypothetical protein n=1 Tax=Leptospira weilii TaxID=28184 RepID=UPI0005616271|nr:hypothetical protein [Leptospira weilii]